MTPQQAVPRLRLELLGLPVFVARCKGRDSRSLGKTYQVANRATLELPSPRLQRLPHGLLINAQRGPNRSKTHPKPPHYASLEANSLEFERILRENHELQPDLRGGSNWLQ